MGLTNFSVRKATRLGNYSPIIAIGGTAPAQEKSSALTSGSSTLAGLAKFYEIISDMSVNKTPDFLNRFPLSGALMDGWDLILPIQISIEREEDGLYLASDETFFIYGAGETFGDALSDYKISLVEYYQLIADRLEGKPENAPLFEKLRHYINVNQ